MLTVKSEYFDEYCRQYSDMPFLVRLDETEGGLVAGRTLRASDFEDNMGQENNPEWKTVLYDTKTNELTVPTGTIGSRWGEEKNWNLETKNLSNGDDIWPEKSFNQPA